MLRAVHLNQASESDCEGNVCGPEADRDRAAAVEAANAATVATVAGGVLLATGAVLFVLGAPNDDAPQLSFGPSGVSFRTAF